MSCIFYKNKTNLRPLIAVTGLLVVFAPWYLELGRVTLENKRGTLFSPSKLCPSFRSHPWRETVVIIRKRWTRYEIGRFLAMGYLFYVPPSLVHYFIAICELKLELSYQNAEIVAKMEPIFNHVTTATRQNNRAPLLCPSKLRVSFHGHLWIHTRVIIRKYVPITVWTRVLPVVDWGALVSPNWAKTSVCYSWLGNMSAVVPVRSSLMKCLAHQSFISIWQIMW